MTRPLLALVIVFGTGCGSGSGTTAAPPEAETTLPNILLVIADDFGLDAASFDQSAPWYDVGDTTNDAPMPTIAALCARGVRFANAWSQPTCSPTRATILTGTHPYQHGVFMPVTQNSATHLDLSSWTLPKALAGSDADYDLASFGKWHVSVDVDDPELAGWPHFAGLLAFGLGDYANWVRTVNGTSAPSTTYATTAQVDDALAWVSARGDKPWFLWLAFNAPHSPFHEPPAALHSQGALGPYVSGDARPWYRAMCESLDTELGRLQAALVANGEWDDTIVIFVGDNGTPATVSDGVYGPGRAKGSLLQGGIHVPLVVAGPGVVGGGRSVDAIVSVADVFATVLELAGLDPEAERARQAPGVTLDSRSIVPLLSQSATEIHETVLAERRTGDAARDGKAIRTLAHKLIVYEDGQVALYDLALDPFETVDLYVDGTGPAPGYDATYVSLRDALRVQVGDPTLGP